MPPNYVYYQPVWAERQARSRGDADLIDSCSIFKMLSENACIVDRTGSLTLPVQMHNLYPIPAQKQDVKSFADLCMSRAEQLLATGDEICLMFSGGLDSTTVLTAFHRVIQSHNLNPDQIIIAASLDSRSENPQAWDDIIMPNYRIVSAKSVLSTIATSRARLVQGEHADQLFGSDRIFTEPHLISQEYNVDALHDYLIKRIGSGPELDRAIAELTVLTTKCPLEIKYMRDFLWWLNFSCKWQNVAIRTLNFSNIFESSGLSLTELERYNSFFNTDEFQQLSISGQLDRWGDSPSPYTYKFAARQFIAEYAGLHDWVKNKIKVGSLYHVIKNCPASAQSLVINNDIISPADFNF